MSISTNYASPVTVNGFSCRNCSEVDQAKKNIDPSNSSAGPFGLNSTKADAAAKARKSGPIAAAALAKAQQQAAANKGSNVLRAYGGTTAAGQFVQLAAYPASKRLDNSRKIGSAMA